jgi:ATP-dependent RNA helicase SUPV3L1/SUV3
VAGEARAADKRMLLAAAEKRLAGELRRRGAALAAAGDDALSLHPAADGALALHWQGLAVATLALRANPVRPQLALDSALAVLEPPARNAVRARLDAWLATWIAAEVPALAALDRTARDPGAGAPLRALAGTLVQAGGLLPRRAAAAQVAALDGDGRKALRRLGVIIGTLDLFVPALLKPAAAAARRTLMRLPHAPPDGATVLPRAHPGAALAYGFRPLGAQAVRVDLVERIARAAHDARQGRKPFAPDPALATSVGLSAETLARLMAQLGFRTARAAVGEPTRWVWQGLVPVAPPPAPPADSPFAALAGLRGG